MKLIDISTNDAMAKTLPPAGKMVKFYDTNDNVFIGMLEYNRWFRPIFYVCRYGNRYRLNFVPKAWDELDNLKEAGMSAGEYADMPALKGATE